MAERFRQGGGSTTAIPSAMWMRHPCSCTARWCGRHRETRFSSSVAPPSAQCHYTRQSANVGRANRLASENIYFGAI